MAATHRNQRINFVSPLEDNKTEYNRLVITLTKSYK
jgi:hypothetical protein